MGHEWTNGRIPKGEVFHCQPVSALSRSWNTSVVLTMHSSDPVHPRASLASSLLPSLYILAMIWAAAVHDISMCDAVVLGGLGLGDGGDGRHREGSATWP